jgi:quercetin dioxygenase-like cupin family protein
LLPALIAAQASAQKNSASVLPSKCYNFSELPVKVNPETHSESRQVFRGETHGGFEVACHMTKLAAGAMPHPPHKHLNEEIFFMRSGTLEITVEGKTCHIGPGSVAFIHSNEMHGAKNVGDVPAEYFVLELDGQKT